MAEVSTVTIPLDRLALITNQGYFARYREHLAAGHPCRVAWAKTENELCEYLNIRRYNTYPSFCDGLRYERKKRLTKRVMFTIIETTP
jgi:hypothetical protein